MQIRSQLTSHVASNRGRTQHEHDLCPKNFGPISQGGRIPACAWIDQVVAGSFPQFVLSGGQGPLVTTNTKKLIENRAIRKKVRFVASSKTRKSSARTAMKFFSLSLSDQLSPGFLDKTGYDTFLHAPLKNSQRFLPCMHFHISWETVDILPE